MTQSAKEIRLDAVRRLADIANYGPQLNIALTLARPRSLDVLYRSALRAAHTNEDATLLDEVRRLYAIAQGKAWALDDAIHDGGLPDESPELQPESTTTLADYEAALAEVFQA